MLAYKEEDYLQLAGIQHFAFCPRQWALIHVEDKWVESYLSASGRVLHNKVHSDSGLEKRGDIVIARSLRISSSTLGISGECDVVEFHKKSNGVNIKGCEGLYKPFPIEYKRGKSKVNDCDRLQLCAQGMCLEEMLICEIKSGAIFYGEPRRREVVEITDELRAKVKENLLAMHNYFKRQFTPKVTKTRKCDSCSLKDECLPKLHKKDKSVGQYLIDGLL